MTLRFACHWILTLSVCSASLAEEDWIVTGRVMDSDGNPVAQADLSPWWRANGSPQRPDGGDFDLNDRDQVSEFWSNVGDMQPWQPGARSDADGRFRLDTHRKMHVLVMDSQRQNGAVYRLQHQGKENVSIELGPLTEVKAAVKIAGSGEKPPWCHAYVNLLQDDKHPLTSPRVVSCGSESGRVAFHLPKGTYQLVVYAVSEDASENIDLRVFPDPRLVIDGTGETIDLGVLTLQPDDPDRNDLEKESIEAGRWRDYTEHYGEPAPKWHAVDARGIDVNKNIDDLRGKWVLLEFWGLGCRPCLAEHMPAVMELYDQHSDQRDRFEVIGICLDIRGKLNRLDEVDKQLKPVVDHVWNGKAIPFPVVLDNSFKTWERYGIPGLGTAVLIDPQGNLVEGGREALERVLSGT